MIITWLRSLLKDMPFRNGVWNLKQLKEDFKYCWVQIYKDGIFLIEKTGKKYFE